MRDMVEQIVQYPNIGDMRAVRPMIRAGEMSVRAMEASANDVPPEWPRTFWDECFRRTQCDPALWAEDPPAGPNKKALALEWRNIRIATIEHWDSTTTTTSTDPKRDTVFGIALYALSCLLEMNAGVSAAGITGRLLLRTLAECRITLAYLVNCADDETWKKFRAYGTGQAKLAFMKLDEMPADEPGFVNMDFLHGLVNEDYFQEFLPVDLGHWCGKDLRRMADESGTKDDYDKYYAWTSAFVHGHWGALRNTSFTQCLNPLHRFHRIPILTHRFMENCVGDGVNLVNAILRDLGKAFPGFTAQFKASGITHEEPAQDDTPPPVT